MRKGDVGIVDAVSSAAFEEGNVRAINQAGTADIIGGDRTVEDVAMGQTVLECGISGAMEFARQGTGKVSSFKFATGEHLLVSRDSLKTHVRGNRCVRLVIRGIHIEPSR